MSGFARTVAAALLFGTGLAGQASASAICDQLGFELATLAEHEDPAIELGKYARAISAQKESLRKLALNMRDTGCSSGSISVVGGPNADECSHLEAKQARMRRNLEILQGKQVSLMSQDRSDRRRNALVAALGKNRCNEEPTLVSTPGEDGSQPLVKDDPNGFETIRVPSDEPDYNDRQFVDLGGAALDGNFQTMCIRTCDGAYFPVSSHASPLNFGRDAQVCSMMCPGTETELYYHPLQSESSEMRSTATGRPYGELENAYRFRTEKPGKTPACGCNFALYYQEMMKRQSYVRDPATIPGKESSIVWLKPVLRSSLAKPDKVAANMAKPKERDYVPSAHIRMIGPKFLPDKRIDFTRPIPGVFK
jgi:hypothetical protein